MRKMSRKEEMRQGEKMRRRKKEPKIILGNEVYSTLKIRAIDLERKINTLQRYIREQEQIEELLKATINPDTNKKFVDEIFNQDGAKNEQN